MNNDIKIIFVDIDWTILNHGNNEHVFDFESIEALKFAQTKGVLVYLCTARPYHSVKHCGILKLFNPDGVIATNGAVVFSKNKIIHNHHFPKEYVEQIIKVMHKHHITLELSNERDRWFSKKPNKYVKQYFGVFNEIYPRVDTYKYKKSNISVILAMCPQKFDEVLRQELPPSINLTRFYEFGLDIHYEPIYKSEGVNAVLDYLKIDKDKAMAIGDEIGDIEMFKSVKYSICMGNGNLKAKEIAKEICPPINEHGVAKVIYKYLGK